MVYYCYTHSMYFGHLGYLASLTTLSESRSWVGARNWPIFIHVHGMAAWPNLTHQPISIISHLLKVTCSWDCWLEKNSTTQNITVTPKNMVLISIGLERRRPHCIYWFVIILPIQWILNGYNWRILETHSSLGWFISITITTEQCSISFYNSIILVGL